jgi:hypothetical protein
MFVETINAIGTLSNAYEISKKSQQVQRTLSPVNFSHEYFSASLLTENFGDDRGNILAPVAEGYDQKIQVVNFDRLLYYIESNLDLEIRR